MQSSSSVDFGTSVRALALRIFTMSEFDFLFLCGNLKRLRGLYLVFFSLEECVKKWACPGKGMPTVFICDQDHILPDTLFDF